MQDMGLHRPCDWQSAFGAIWIQGQGSQEFVFGNVSLHRNHAARIAALTGFNSQFRLWYAETAFSSSVATPRRRMPYKLEFYPHSWPGSGTVGK